MVATIQIEDRESFVYFRWEGLLKEEEMKAVAAEHFPRLANRNKLFDMTRADFSALTEASLSAVAQKVLLTQPGGGTQKTAFVAVGISSRLLLSRYSVIAFESRVPVEYRVFGDVDQAVAWLKSSA